MGHFNHPEARCFGVGKLGPDPLADSAQRKGMSIDEAARWLSPNLDETPRLAARTQSAA